MKKTSTLFLLVSCCIIINSRTVFAETQGFDSISLRPQAGNRFFIFVPTTEMLEVNQFVLQPMVTYSWKPLQFRSTEIHNRSLIDHMTLIHIGGAYGLFQRRAQIRVDIPFGFVTHRPFMSGSSSTTTKSSFGDLLIEPSIRVFGVDSLVGLGKNFSLSAHPFLTVPTGGSEYYLGNPRPSAGFRLVLEAQITDRIRLNMGSGFLFQEETQITDTTYYHQILYHAGLALRATRRLNFSVEGAGRTLLLHPYRNRMESPLEASAGFQYALSDSVRMKSGVGFGIIRHSMAPQMRLALGLSWSTGEKR